MKLNNKGLTLVELIVSFVILVLFLFGMLEIVLAVKNKAANEFVSRDMLTYKETLLKVVEDDLIKIGLNNATCSNDTCTLNLKNAMVKTFRFDITNKIIEYDGIKYEIPSKDRIYFGTVQMNVESLDENNNVLVISIEYYEEETTEPNYGIKIKHPFLKP